MLQAESAGSEIVPWVTGTDRNMSIEGQMRGKIVLQLSVNHSLVLTKIPEKEQKLWELQNVALGNRTCVQEHSPAKEGKYLQSRWSWLWWH